MATVTKTIGTSSRDYSTISAWEADLSDASIYSNGDDAVGEMYADSTFTGNTVTIDGGTSIGGSSGQDLNSVKLTVATASRHDGTAESGALLKPTSGSGHSVGIIKIARDDFTIEWLDISLDSLDSTNTNYGIRNNVGDNIIIRNCLLHDKYGNPGSTGPRAIYCDRMSSGATFTVQNNIIYRWHETSNDTAVAVMTHNANPGSEGGAKIYNNTIYFVDSAGSSKHAVGIYFAGGTADAVKNNIVAGLYASGDSDHERAYQAAYYDLADVSNNLSDTTTSADWNAADMGDSYGDSTALVGKSLAEIDFVSTVAGSEDLHLDTGSVCLEAGADLGTTNGVNVDIDGLDRDATGVTWDIGADQKSEASTSTGNPAFIMFVD